LATTTGKFFDRTRESKADGQAYDPTAREKLRVLSARLAGEPTRASARTP
jgi:hypothetical protein